MSGLLPCPFCGGVPLYQAHRIAEDAMVAFVNCQRCGVQTEHFEDAYAPREQAIAAWNTRSNSFPELVAALEAADDFICEMAGEEPLMDFADAHPDAGRLLLTIRKALSALEVGGGNRG